MKYARHIHVLQLLSTIPQCDYRTRDEELQKKCETAWDILFTYIHDNWDIPSTAIVEGAAGHPTERTNAEKEALAGCGEILVMDHKTFCERIETLPPYFAEWLFPIAVARFMLRDLQLPINHRNLKTFNEFHRRYGSLVLDC